MGSLTEWGGEFEPVLSGLSSGAHMFYGWYVMGPMCIFFSFLARRTSLKRGTAHSLHHVYTRPIEPVFIFSRTIRNNYLMTFQNCNLVFSIEGNVNFCLYL